jgi:hypothetical protein
MRLLPLLSLVAIIAGTPRLAAAQQHKEYFTEAEIDAIRDAQEIKLRIPVLFDLADRRLFFLGIKEKTEKQIEEDRKIREKRQKEAQKVAKAGGPKPAEPVDPDAYLADFTKSELLRGYVEALDEAMNNIDDAYERKFDVRESLEDLEKYTRDTLPLFDKYQSKSGTEQAALLDARDKTQEALNGAREAMGTVPKTEKKSKK